MLKSLAILAVLFAVTQAPVPATGQASNNEGNKNPSNQPKTSHSKTASQNPALIPEKPAGNQPQNEPENHSAANTQDSVAIINTTAAPNKRDGFDYTSLGVGIILAFITGAGVIAAWRGLPELKRQAEAAKNAAIAAKEAIDLSRETAKRQLRAYVCVSAAHITFAKPEMPEIEVHIKNCGLTPAYSLQGWAGVAIHSHPLTEPLGKPPEGFLAAKSIVPPGGHEIMPARFKTPIPPQMLPVLGTPGTTIYVHGRVTYRDAFKDEQWMEFRLLFGGPEKVGFAKNKDGVVAGRLKPDTEGNEAS